MNQSDPHDAPAAPPELIVARPIAEPPLQPAMVCRKCGAVNPPHASSCWVCDGQTQSNPFAAPPRLEPLSSGNAAATSPTNSRVDSIFMVLLLAMFGLATLVGIGIGVQDRGLLIPYLMIIGPAFLATGTRAAYSLAQGQQPKGSSLIMVFIWSAVFTAAILSLMVVASVIALLVICIRMLGGAM